MAKPLSLADYAAANPPRRPVRCWTCSLPQVAEINATYRAGTATPVQIVKWLVEVCGVDPKEASPNKLKHHFNSMHDASRPAK